jgi:hypothetical protein
MSMSCQVKRGRSRRRCGKELALYFKDKEVCEECWQRLMHDNAPPGAIYEALGYGKDYRASVKAHEEFKRRQQQDQSERRPAMARRTKKTKKAKATRTKKVTKKEGPGRGLVGRTSGLKVAAFWGQLMKTNFKERLNDEQLCKAMNKEFPPGDGEAYDVADVKAHRNLYNKGKLRFQEAAPKKPLHEFDKKKNALPLWGTRGATKKKRSAPKDDVQFSKPAKAKRAKAKVRRARASA